MFAYNYLKLCVIFSFFLLFCFNAKCQNLVPNPSFETFTSCPNSAGQINKAMPWVAVISSPDYFNACSTNTDVTVPKNFFGTNYQQAKSGNAYAGIITLGDFGSNMRENLGAQLSTSLINGYSYLVKFYIANMQTYFLANNNIALNFSSSFTYTVASGSTVNLPMHIYKFGNPVIKDTLNWTEIIGIYKANGTEQYITIGNFKDDMNTKIDTTNYGWINYQRAYYMIDDVSVEPICTPFWSYRDTTVTIGDSVLIGPAITGLNINWYDSNNNFIKNAPGIYVKPNSTTYYTATEDFCNGVTSHTINVTVTPTWVKEYNDLTSSFNVYPNPASENVFISSTKYKANQFNYSVTDMLGKVVLTEQKTEQFKTDLNKTIDLSALANGVYFLNLYNQDGLLKTKKIIKQ